MSSYVEKYIVHYDANDSTTCNRELYVKYDGVWDGQLWLFADGTPVNFGCITDNGAEVIAKCILGIPTNDKYFFWEKVNNFNIPDAVNNVFYPK